MRPYAEIKQQQADKLEELIKYAGNVVRLAKALNVPYQTAAAWKVRGRISAVMAIEAERITNGVITKEDLRPDVEQWNV